MAARSDSAAHFVAGGLAGLFSSILVHPLDMIRTRMQVHAGPGSRYNSVVDGLRTTLRTDGWRGLYAGLAPSLVGSGVSWGFFLLFYAELKSRNAAWLHLDAASTWTHLVSAAEAGLITSILTNPLWLVKTRLELQSRSPALPVAASSASLVAPVALAADVPRPYRGLVDCLVRVAREEGVGALYRGLVPSMWLCVHGAIQFAAYESLKQSVWLRSASSHVLGADVSAQSNSAYTFTIAALSKMAAATVTFPLTTVRSRIQERPKDGALGVPPSIWQMSVQIARREGVRGFFKGLTPCLLRVTPHSACMLVAYEKCMTLFQALPAGK